MGTAFDRKIVGGSHVVHLNGNVGDAVAVEDEALNFGMAGPQRRDEYERDAALLHDVGGLVLHLRLEPGVGDNVEAEGVPVEERTLPGVADEEANVIDLAKRNVLHDGSRPTSGHGWAF